MIKQISGKVNRNIIIVITVLIVLIIGGLLVFSDGSKIAQEDTEGTAIKNTAQEEKFDQVPAFTLNDWNGNEVSLSDFKGKPLIINSWAVWCPFCLDELPDFAKLQEEMGDRIIIIAIDRAESTARQKKFTDELEVTGKLLFLNDPSDSFYKSIGGFSMPETLFVDKDGNILIHKRGPMKFNEMKEKVNSILNDGGV